MRASKCYSIIADYFGVYDTNQVPNNGNWRVFHHFNTGKEK